MKFDLKCSIDDCRTRYTFSSHLANCLSGLLRQQCQQNCACKCSCMIYYGCQLLYWFGIQWNLCQSSYWNNSWNTQIRFFFVWKFCIFGMKHLDRIILKTPVDKGFKWCIVKLVWLTWWCSAHNFNLAV